MLHASAAGARFPLFAFGFWGLIRLFDFHHFTRQSFGVYQLFKARTGVRPAAWVRRAESGFFAATTATLFVTFLAGGVCPLLQPGGRLGVADLGPPLATPALPLNVSQPAAALGLLVTIALGIAATAGPLRAWRRAGRPRGLAFALAYLALQSAGALMATVSFPLYLAALAIHYVEYHVLMDPRVFHSETDDTFRIDR